MEGRIFTEANFASLKMGASPPAGFSFDLQRFAFEKADTAPTGALFSVTKLDGTYYGTEATDFTTDNLSDATNITLLNNLSTDNSITLSSDCTFDFGKKKLTYTGTESAIKITGGNVSLTMQATSNSTSYGIAATQGNAIEVTGGTVTSGVEGKSYGPTFVTNATSGKAGILVNGGTVNLTGGKAQSSTGSNAAEIVSGTFNMSGGYLQTGTGTTATGAALAVHEKGATVTLSGYVGNNYSLTALKVISDSSATGDTSTITVNTGGSINARISNDSAKIIDNSTSVAVIVNGGKLLNGSISGTVNLQSGTVTALRSSESAAGFTAPSSYCNYINTEIVYYDSQEAAETDLASKKILATSTIDGKTINYTNLATAYADSDNVTVTDYGKATAEAMIGDKYYNNLYSAFSAATAGQTIIVNKDISGTGISYRFTLAKEVTLDLNGKTVKLNSGYFTVNNNGNLTIKDSTEVKDSDGNITTEGTGTINFTGSGNDGGVRVKKGGEFTLESGILNAAKTITPVVVWGEGKATINGGTLHAANSFALSGNGTESTSSANYGSNTDITITGGTLISDKAAAIYHPQVGGTLTISGGTITGEDTGLEIRAGTLNITGGTFEATAETYTVNPNGNGSTSVGAGIAVAQHTTQKELNVTINGNADIKGAVALAVSNPQSNENNAPAVTINGGTFTGTAGTAVAAENADKRVTVVITDGTFNGALNSQNDNNGGYSITGGVFSTDVSDYVAEGKTEEKLTLDGEEIYVVGDVVDKFISRIIDDQTLYYSTEDLAKAAITGLDTVEFINESGSTNYYYSKTDSGASLKKAKMNSAVAKIGSKYYSTLDLAYNAAVDGDTIKLIQSVDSTSVSTIDKKITIDLNGKTLTLTNNFGVSSEFTLSDSVSGGELIGNISVEAGGTFNMRGGSIMSRNQRAVNVDGTGIFNMYGGRVFSYQMAGVYKQGAGSINVYGGLIRGATGIKLLAGLLNILGGKIRGFAYSTTGNVVEPQYVGDVVEPADGTDGDDNSGAAIQIVSASGSNTNVKIGQSGAATDSGVTKGNIDIAGNKSAVDIGGEGTNNVELYDGKLSSVTKTDDSKTSDTEEANGSAEVDAITYGNAKSTLMIDGGILANKITVKEEVTNDVKVGNSEKTTSGQTNQIVIKNIAIEEKTALENTTQDEGIETAVENNTANNLRNIIKNATKSMELDASGYKISSAMAKKIVVASVPIETSSSSGNVVEPAAVNDDASVKSYSTLESAIKAAEENQDADNKVVILEQNISISTPVTINSGIKIDFNGYTLTKSDNASSSGGVAMIVFTPTDDSGDVLTLTDGNGISGFGIQASSENRVKIGEKTNWGVAKVVSNGSTTLFNDFALAMDNLGEGTLGYYGGAIGSGALSYAGSTLETAGASFYLDGISNGNGISISADQQIITLSATNFADAGASVISGDYAYNIGEGTGGIFYGNATLADTINNSGSGILINAGGGSDSIVNNGADATINGGAGADTITNNAKAVVDGGDDADSITNSGVSAVVYGGGGSDTITNDGASATVYGGDDNDNITNSVANAVLYGDAGNDTITNSGASATLDGGADDDSLVGGDDGADTFVFSGGSDTVNNYGTNDIFSLSSDFSPIYDGSKVTTVSGGGFQINFDGANFVTFEGTPTVQLKVGNEKSIYYTAGSISEGNSITLTAGYTGSTYSIGENDSYTSINAAAVNVAGGFSIATGTNGAYYVIGSDNVQTTIIGGTGADTLKAGASAAYIDGGAGANYIVGSANNDTVTDNGKGTKIYGGAGADSISVSGASASVYGGAGADKIIVSGASAYVDGGGGSNTINVSDDSATINVGGGTDFVDVATTASGLSLVGFTSNDTIGFGLSIASYTVNGTELTVTFKDNSTTTIKGVKNTAETIETAWVTDGNTATYASFKTEAGSYSYVGGESKALVFTGTTSLDGDALLQLSGLQSTNGITINTETKKVTLGEVNLPDNDTVQIMSYSAGYTFELSDGDYNGATLIGTDGADTIKTNGKNIVINGGAGNDSLVGGDGNDYLIGGEGNDTFVVGKGKDTIADFATGDALSGVTEVTEATKLLSNGDTFTLNLGESAVTFLGNAKVTIGDYTYTKDAIISGTSATLGVNTDSDYSLPTNVTAVDASKVKNSIELKATSTVNNIIGSDNAAVTITGTTAAETLKAGKAGATIAGGGGNDLLVGDKEGADLFVYSSGNVTIDNYTASDSVSLGIAAQTDASKVNTVDGGFEINFANNVKLTFKDTDVPVTVQDKNGDEYVYSGMSIVSGNKVTLTKSWSASAFDASKYSVVDASLVKVDGFAITGGTTRSSIVGSTSVKTSIKGGDANDTLKAQIAESTLNGGGGDDLLVGIKNENDTFIFSAGKDTIQQYNEGDVIELSDLNVATNANNVYMDGKDLVIKFSNDNILTVQSTKAVSIKGGESTYYYADYSIAKDDEEISLGSGYGTVYSAANDKYKTINASKVETISVTGNSEGNTIYGGVNGTIDGGEGNDLLISGGGSTVFKFGDGKDTIQNYSYESDWVEVDKNITDITDAAVTTTKDGNLVIDFNGSDKLTFTNVSSSGVSVPTEGLSVAIKRSNRSYEFSKDSIVSAYDNSVTLNASYSGSYTGEHKTIDARAVTNAIAITANSLDNSIYGGSSATIDGGSGKNKIFLDDRRDTAKFTLVYNEGKDTVENFDQNNDTLQIAGISNVVYARSTTSKFTLKFDKNNTLILNDGEISKFAFTTDGNSATTGSITADGYIVGNTLNLFPSADGTIDLTSTVYADAGITEVSALKVTDQSVTIAGASTGGTFTFNGDGYKNNDVFQYGGGFATVVNFEGSADKIDFGDRTVSKVSATDKDVTFTTEDGQVVVQGITGEELWVRQSSGRYKKMVFPQNGVFLDKKKNPTSATVSAGAGSFDANTNKTVKKITVEGGDVTITASDSTKTMIDASGASGSVTLIGGKKDDKFTASDNADLFVYAKGGKDVINGFGEGDQISLSSTAGISSVKDIISVDKSNSKVKLTFSTKDILTINGTVDTVNINGVDYQFTDDAIVSNNQATLTSDTSGSKTVKKLTYTYLDGSNVENNLRLTGNGDADTLIGGATKTTLNGGNGDDSLVGGTGKDTFVYTKRQTGEKIISNFDVSKDTLKIANTTIYEITGGANDITFNLSTGKNSKDSVASLTINSFTDGDTTKAVNPDNVVIKAKNNYYWFAKEDITNDEGDVLASAGDLITSSGVKASDVQNFDVINLNYATNLYNKRKDGSDIYYVATKVSGYKPGN